jgi:alkylated DNA nucleotide flippase Atl1
VTRLPDYEEAVLEVVDAIPQGCVLTYGDVAEMVGVMGPRRVGRVMSQYGAATTWWRVVRAGGLPPAGLEEEALGRWRAEGTPLVGGALSGERVDMRRARWDGTAAGGAVGGV